MILKYSLFIPTTLFVLGQNCSLPSGKTGYCREEGHCFGSSEGNGCENGMICCHKTETSFEKCQGYGVHVFTRSYRGALTARVLIHNASQCSIEAIPLIVGGSKAKPKEFPHMVRHYSGIVVHLTGDKSLNYFSGGNWIRGEHRKRGLAEVSLVKSSSCLQRTAPKVRDEIPTGKLLRTLVNEAETLVILTKAEQSLDYKSRYFCWDLRNFFLLIRGPARFARLGSLRLKDPAGDSNHQDFSIAERINHPKYKPPSRYNDIALYKLSNSVEINGFVRPGCLHTEPNEFKLKKGVATGWGKMDYNSYNGSDDLLKVSLDFIDNSKCNTFFISDFGGRSLRQGIISSQICAGVLLGGKDTCQGDSGGPLQVVKENPYCMYSIVGITSFGKFCAFKNSPAVYTRVSYYIPWIESIVWK